MSRSSDYESILAKARKILALAQDANAPDGEKAAARAALTRLLRQHDLSLDDFRNDTTTIHWFPYRSKHERILIQQVIYLVKGVPGDCYMRRVGKRKLQVLGADLTAAEAIDVRAGFQFYRKAWKRHVALQFDAFIQAHNIFGAPTGDDSEPIDWSRQLAILQAASAINGPSWVRPAAPIEGEDGLGLPMHDPP